MIANTYLRLKKLAKSQGSLFVGSGLLTFIRLSAGLILLKLIALIGGNSAVAMYGQVHNFVSMLNGVIASGVGDGVVKMTAQSQSDPSKLNIIKFTSALLISLGALIVIFISIMLWEPLIDWVNIGNVTRFQIAIYLVGALLASIGTLLISLANGLQLLDRVVKTNIISIVAALTISGVFLFLQGETVVTVIPAINLGLIGIFQIGMLVKKVGLPINTLNFIDFGAIRHLGGYMAMAVGSYFMTPFTIITIRGWLINDYGSGSAGDWESSRKLLELITGLLTAYFAMVLLPRLAKISDSKNLRIELINNAMALAVLSSIALFLLYALRHQAYYVIFSSDFKFSSDLMGSRAIGEFLRGLVWIFGFILVVKAKVKLYLLMGFFYMLVLLSTSWFMIADYGMIGANYAYIASNSLMLLVSVIIFFHITSDSHFEYK